MGLVSIVPEYFLKILGPMSDIRAVPLTSPVIEHSVGLVAVDRDPVSPIVLAVFQCARVLQAPSEARKPYGSWARAMSPSEQPIGARPAV